MKKDAPFTITEWDWFKTQLRLHALEYGRSEMLSYYFDFEADDTRKIRCQIYGKHAQTMVEAKASRKEQLEYYKDWVEGRKIAIAEILEKFPVLTMEFDLEKDIKFWIMYHYGMGGGLICEFIGKKISWKKQ